MFQPKSFKQTDEYKQLKLIQQFPLATIITPSNNGLVSNHIPLLCLQRGDKYILQGHVAKINSFYNNYDLSQEILCVFNGPNAYISPNWYPSKQKDGKAVPTWNYAVVHVYGKLKTFDDKQWLLDHLDLASQSYEKDQAQPWSLSDAPDSYINSMTKAIIGIEIEISKIIANTKMSQNHSDENRLGVIEGLEKLDKFDVADWVKKS
jgi:transcriptional regulator